MWEVCCLVGVVELLSRWGGGKNKATKIPDPTQASLWEPEVGAKEATCPSLRGFTTPIAGVSNIWFDAVVVGAFQTLSSS